MRRGRTIRGELEDVRRARSVEMVRKDGRELCLAVHAGHVKRPAINVGRGGKGRWAVNRKTREGWRW